MYCIISQHSRDIVSYFNYDIRSLYWYLVRKTKAVRLGPSGYSRSGGPSYNQAVLGLEGHMLLSRGDISAVLAKLPWMLNDSTLRVRRGS
jgi:hypothetical protein